LLVVGNVVIAVLVFVAGDLLLLVLSFVGVVVVVVFVFNISSDSN
jgi:hypothetical protein